MTRELDELVARALGLEVVGWHNANEDPEIPGWWHFSRDGKGQQLAYIAHCMCGLYNASDDWWADLKPLPCGHLYMCLAAVPFYSSDLATAWALVDKILEQPDMTVMIEMFKDVPGSGEAIVNCEVWSKDEKTVADVDAETPAEAICQAFIKWRAAGRKPLGIALKLANYDDNPLPVNEPLFRGTGEQP